jgi:transmembrane sensor
MWSGVVSRTAAERRPRWQWGVAVAAAAACALVVVRVWPVRAPGGPLRLADGGAVGTLAQDGSAAAREVALNDGSQLSLSPGSTLDVLENSGERFDVQLRTGRVGFEVHPGGPRRWIIEAGVATVEVVGTRFEVNRTPQGVDVDVFRGIVLVRGERVPGQVQRLVKGGHLHVDALVKAAVSLPPPPAVVEPPPAEHSAQPARAAPPLRRPAPEHAAESSPPAWEKLAQAQQFKEAYGALGPSGTVGVDLEHLPIDRMLEVADVARRSGHPEEAVQVLLRVVERFPADRNSAVAAFTRGRIEADQLNHSASAAEAFAQALQLGLPGALDEDARVRLVEARHKSSDAAGARAAFDEYVARYPQGRDRARLQALLLP